ncbi:POTRA domain-containing protein [Edwardsiella anguillarum]|nr:POTRA domain-containing protein [Edwardsiella anguillarum]
MNRRWLFPGAIGKPLRLASLDQGLDQANRLRSNHVSMDILPGERVGGSVIRLYNRRGRPGRSAARWTTTASKAPGSGWRAAATLDSPLGLSDFVSLSASTTLARPSARYSRAYMLFTHCPMAT